ncbi:MAG TPA: NUDIX domain-containing protein [Candidatus Saccharimonadales bacterium]|nr:NUDIX domain-containing protein [Candidatus Saccharimonadales bacterium]
MGKFDTDILAVGAEYVVDIASQALTNGGFVAFDRPDYYTELLQHCATRQRGLLEDDPSFKQIIPYLVLTHEDRVFYYARPAGINEQRLANKISIGVGGHIELEDIAHADQTIQAAVTREVKEEIGENVTVTTITPLGFLYNEASQVDRVHLGILMIGTASTAELQVDDEEIGRHGFVTAEQLDQMVQGGGYEAENWTKIAWQHVRQRLNIQQ